MRYSISSFLLLATVANAIGGDFDNTIYEQYKLDTLKYSYPQLSLYYGLNHHHNTSQNFQGDSVHFESREFNSDLDLKGNFYNYFESESRKRSFTIKSIWQVDIRDVNMTSNEERSSIRDYKWLTYDMLYADQFYFSGSPQWSWGVHAQLSGLIDKRNSNSETIGPNYENYSDQISQYFEQEHYLGFNIGRGKVRNVTSVHRALQVIDRLEDIGVPTEGLTASDVLQIAHALDTKDVFSRLHYRSGKKFWEYVAKELNSVGISIDELDTYSTLHVIEAVNLLHHSRYSGQEWAVGSRIQYHKNFSQYQEYDKFDSLVTEFESWDEDIYFLLNPTFSLYRPLSLNTSLNFNAELLAGPAINSKSDYNQQYSLGLNSALQYDLTDRFMASISGQYDFTRWNYNETLSNYSPDFDKIRNQFTTIATLKYYLIDIAHISLTYTHKIGGDGYIDRELSPDEKWRNGYLVVSLTYGPGSPSVY